MQLDPEPLTAEPRGIADIIRRFDSGSAWGSPQNSPRSQGSPQFSPLRAKGAPRISAFRPNQYEEDEVQMAKGAVFPAHSRGTADESAKAAERAAANSNVSDADDNLSMSRQSLPDTLTLPQLEGQGSLALP